jgi:two-component system OmpR family sensor kinase
LKRTDRGDVESSIGTVRYLAVPVRGDRVDGAFVVLAALEAERDEVEDAVRLAAVVLVSVLLIASALAWLVAGRILAPLQQLGDTARSITDTDLTRRIPAAGSDEIAELARTFNAMLDRLERAFASQRAFVSDASHELRTPITIVRGHLELLGDDPEERRETIALVTDELDRMSRFVDDLLLLAKAERDDFLRLDELELGALTDELLDKAGALAARTWKLEGRAEALLRGDRQRLTQAVMGLAQNAVQHTTDGDPIWLGSAADDREARLWVRDSGPGVELADQERIFERFARAQASRRRSQGAGLGLAIVRAIAESHGGRVELSSRPSAGATFTVVIPLAAQPEEELWAGS